MSKTEMRDLTSNIEIREDDNGRTISGYAVKWKKKSKILGYFRKFQEQFKNGAFAESLKEDDQRFLWSHDVSKVLGRTGNETLRLREDDVGLHFELDLPNTTLGNDTYESIKRGDVDGVSFGFRMEAEEIQDNEGELTLRTITKAKLLEVSAVAFPAYPDSKVSARGYDRMKEYDEELKNIQEEQRAKINILLNI